MMICPDSWWRRLGYEVGKLILLGVILAGLWVLAWAVIQAHEYDKQGRWGERQTRSRGDAETRR